MHLTPRYGTDPVIVVDGAPASILEPTARQRRRLVEAASSFSDDQWASPTRCDGWTVRDVIVHLDSTNAFWGFSVASARKGEPTRALEHFDPVGDPAALVAGSTSSSAQVLADFAASTERLIALLAALDEHEWEQPAEAPVGHLSVGSVVHHALWDAFVHERDILVPLGIDAGRHEDEIAACLRYVAALGPALAVNEGRPPVGTFSIHAFEPDLAITVDVTDQVRVHDTQPGDPEPLLIGDAVALIDALSLRGPFPVPVPVGERWRLGGLAEAFDQSG